MAECCAGLLKPFFFFIKRNDETTPRVLTNQEMFHLEILLKQSVFNMRGETVEPSLTQTGSGARAPDGVGYRTVAESNITVTLC
jgi:hypothetical protein